MQVDWPQLIELHSHAVVLSLLARGVRLSRARELTHETWARLFEQHQAGLIHRLELPGLAIRQAGFLALREGRRWKTEPLSEVPEACALTDLGPSAEARVEGRQQLELAQAALATLGPRAREIFTVAVEHPEVSQSSLAEGLGLSLQRFRQTLCEVRARLRAALDDRGGGR
jgi:RNA polymerase sigma-70 factor (ECF subfamily)